MDDVNKPLEKRLRSSLSGMRGAISQAKRMLDSTAREQNLIDAGIDDPMHEFTESDALDHLVKDQYGYVLFQRYTAPRFREASAAPERGKER